MTSAELVSELQAYVDACSGPGITLYDGHPAVLIAKARDAITTLERERDEAHKIARDLTKALVGLTPGGSEYFVRSKLLDDYFADTERCVAVVRDRYDSGHRAKIERVDLQRDLTASQAQVERLKDALAIATPILSQYADFIRRVPAKHIEEHPYLPSVDGAIEAARAALQVEESKG